MDSLDVRAGDAVVGGVVAVVVAVALALTAPSVWDVPARVLLAPVLVALCIVDLRERRLPDRLLLPAIAGAAVLLSVAAIADGSPHRIATAVLGALLDAGLLLVLHLVHPAGLGFGDVKLGLLLGLYLGSVEVGLVIWGLLAGSLLGVLIAVPAAVRARDRRASIPFGPPLCGGAVLTLVLAGL